MGQNFLIDRNVARRIVAEAGIEPDDQVLEIGPGRGALTRLLVARASRVVAVEIDSDLAAELSGRIEGNSSLDVVSQDALEFDASAHFDHRYKLVANLPYYVATPIVRRFLTIHPRPSSIVVMVQREVADNMAAGPGRMGLLSVMVQLHASVKILFSVPPGAFRPRPKVASAVVRLEPLDAPAVAVDDASSFIGFVAAGFRAPRKQLRNSLKIGLQVPSGSVASLLDSARVDGSRRPSTLGMAEWGDLYTVWLERDGVEVTKC